MAWIPMIPESEAEGELKDWYKTLKDPWGGVDYIMKIPGNFPHTILQKKFVCVVYPPHHQKKHQ